MGGGAGLCLRGGQGEGSPSFRNVHREEISKNIGVRQGERLAPKIHQRTESFENRKVLPWSQTHNNPNHHRGSSMVPTRVQRQRHATKNGRNDIEAKPLEEGGGGGGGACPHCMRSIPIPTHRGGRHAGAMQDGGGRGGAGLAAISVSSRARAVPSWCDLGGCGGGQAGGRGAGGWVQPDTSIPPSAMALPSTALQLQGIDTPPPLPGDGGPGQSAGPALPCPALPCPAPTLPCTSPQPRPCPALPPPPAPPERCCVVGWMFPLTLGTSAEVVIWDRQGLQPEWLTTIGGTPPPQTKVSSLTVERPRRRVPSTAWPTLLSQGHAHEGGVLALHAHGATFVASAPGNSRLLLPPKAQK